MTGLPGPVPPWDKGERLGIPDTSPISHWGTGGLWAGPVVCCCRLPSVVETNSMHLFPAPSSVTSPWWLEIHPGGRLYLHPRNRPMLHSGTFFCEPLSQHTTSGRAGQLPGGDFNHPRPNAREGSRRFQKEQKVPNLLSGAVPAGVSGGAKPNQKLHPSCLGFQKHARTPHTPAADVSVKANLPLSSDSAALLGGRCTSFEVRDCDFERTLAPAPAVELHPSKR